MDVLVADSVTIALEFSNESRPHSVGITNENSGNHAEPTTSANIADTGADDDAAIADGVADDNTTGSIVTGNHGHDKPKRSSGNRHGIGNATRNAGENNHVQERHSRQQGRDEFEVT